MVLQDLLFKRFINLFFEVFSLFFPCLCCGYNQDQDTNQFAPTLVIYNNYYHFSSLTSTTEFCQQLIMEWSLNFVTAHRLQYIILLSWHRILVIGVCPLTIFIICCTRGNIRNLVSAVFHCKIAVIFNILINYAFEHI